MNRIELIFSQVLEEDFADLFRKNMITRYTEFPSVKGQGFSTPKLGNDIWPQLNAMIVVYCADDEKAKVLAIVAELRKKYFSEGIACFVSSAEEA
jgi:hypothetical protein